jgi:hypothetical protein
MSKKLERSRDEEIEKEKRLSLLEGNNRMNNFSKNNKHVELLESESDEYIEEEDEEDGEIEDDEDDIGKEFKNADKRKLEQKPIWSRKKSDNMVVESEDTLSNADIIIKNPEKKDKNENQKKEKFISLNSDSKNQSDISKKINFFTKPNDIYVEVLNNSKKTEHRNLLNYFSVNNDSKDNKNLTIRENQNNINDNYNNNELNLIANDNPSKNIKMMNPNNNTAINNILTNANNVNNENKSNFLQPENRFTSEVKKMNISSSLHQISNPPQHNKIKLNLPEIFNCYKLNKLTKEIFMKYNFKSLPPNFEAILFFLQDKLKIYLRIYIKRLISISRIRNVNFNLYSNNPNGQIHYKFKTYNWEVSNNNVTYSPAKIFDILFTSNYKKKFDLIEEYVELNNKKTKFEKLSSCKEKYEESNKNKGIESTIKITDGPNPTIKLLPGRRTKKKNNNFFKEMRKKIVQSKKKEDLNKQKSNTKNTLDAILNDSMMNRNMSFTSLPNLIDGNSTNLMDVSSKMSDTMSYHNLSYTNNYNNTVNNEISMNIFTYFDPIKDGKIYGRQKKKINLKDFIFLLENSNEFIPHKILLLNRAAIDNTNNK